MVKWLQELQGKVGKYLSVGTTNLISDAAGPKQRNSMSCWTGTPRGTRTGKSKASVYTSFLSLYPDLTTFSYLAVTCMSTTAKEGDNRFGSVE